MQPAGKIDNQNCKYKYFKGGCGNYLGEYQRLRRADSLTVGKMPLYPFIHLAGGMVLASLYRDE
tara:strand:- start:149 stop:340 length:192 start_codon:yes stop_codon:yes gene_type:complete